MLNTRHIAIATSIFTTVSYLLCVAFGLLTPDVIHMHHLLELVLPAFVWISVKSFLIGLVESILWGSYLGGGYSLAYNFTHKSFVREDRK